MLFSVLFATIGLTWAGCSPKMQVKEQAFDGMIITGIIKYIEIEGGFYGIISDDGNKYDPVNLAPEYRKDGLRIKAGVSVQKNMISIHMWGTLIRINQIQVLDYSR
jgi:hypothetical protein